MKHKMRGPGDLLRRIGAGLSAEHQGEFLHRWLPAMAERPDEQVGPAPSPNRDAMAPVAEPGTRVTSARHARAC